MIAPYVLHESVGVNVKHPLLMGWNSDSKFLHYVSWFECVQGSRLELSSDSFALYPAMLPYPDALLSASVVVGSDEAVTWWIKAFLNSFVAWNNFVTLGCPAPNGSAYEPRVGHRSMEGIRVFTDGLLGEMREFVSLDLVLGRLGCEGKRASIEQLLAQVSSKAGACYMSESASGGLPSVALPVVSDRLAIPRKAGEVDPVEWLEPSRAKVVANLEKLRLPEPLWEDIVVACHRVEPAEEPALAQTLLDTGMAVLVPEADLPRDVEGRLLTGGLFCVAKNSSEDRLIYDRRPENATMERLNWAKLPSGACFTRMLLRPNQYLRGSGDDLRNYYYSLRLPSGWVRYNSVGRRVHPEVVRKQGLDPKTHFRLCFRVLGMGDKNGCCIAQATHEAVLRKHGVLDPSVQLVYGKHVPGGDLWEGVYLDDLLVTQRCTVPYEIPLDGSFIPPDAQVTDMDMEQVQLAELAYAEARLERATHKAFRAQTFFKAWGAEIDGVRGTVGAPMEVRQQLWVLIEKLVASGFACKSVLQKINGYLSFCFQYRRELYALQHHIFKHIDRMDARRWVRLPQHIADELRSCALHLPFARCSMRRRLSSTILATDATPTSGGSVLAEVPDKLASELWRRSEIRGEAVRLDRDADFMWDAQTPSEPSKFASIVAECASWRVVGSYTFRKTSHINLQEARALRRELIRMAANPKWKNSIVICLNDSRVVVGCMAKGRSSSFRLNGILRTLIPHLVTANLGLGLLWVETSSNIADYPSRSMPLPPPGPAPRWLRRCGLPGKFVGLEIFSGEGRITSAHVSRGFDMLDPVDIRLGKDVHDVALDQLIRTRSVAWIWLAPPCSSFSPLRNLDPCGPLRPWGRPQGDEAHPDVAHGNQLWRRALQLAALAVEEGVYIFIEHPASSKAWLMPETQKFMCRDGIKLHRVDWCAYPDCHRVGLPNLKPTRIMSNAPWLESVLRRCPKDHDHAPALRGVRATRAGAYPSGFCESLADALAQWKAIDQVA